MDRNLIEEQAIAPAARSGVKVQNWLLLVGIVTTVVTLINSFAVAQQPGGTADRTPAVEEVSQPVSASAVARPILRTGSQGIIVSELQALLKLLGYYTEAVDGLYRESTAIAVSAFQREAGLTPDGIVGPATWDRLLPTPATTNRSSTAASPTSASTPSAFPTPTSTSSAASPTPAAGTPSSPAPASASPTATSASGAAANTTAASATLSPVTSDRRDSPATLQPTTVDLPVLRVGTRGPAVTRLQERLRTIGFFNGTVDGIFGSETQTAVKAAQRNFRLEPDGIVGPATWSALLR